MNDLLHNHPAWLLALEMTKPNPGTMMVCPHCGCDIGENHFDQHRRRAHPESLPRPQPTAGRQNVISAQARPQPAALSTIKKETRVRRQETTQPAAAPKLASPPRKCANPACTQIVAPGGHLCQSCQEAAIDAARSQEPQHSEAGQCRTCGAPTVTGEDYCYGCLGR